MAETRRQAGLRGYLDTFEKSFRSGRELLEYFDSVGAVIWAKEAPGFVQAPSGSWYLLVRLRPEWELRYGLTREFVVYCTPVSDLQLRAVRQTAQIIQHVRRVEERHVEAGYAVIFTRDRLAEQKVRDWGQTTAFTVVPLTVDLIRSAAEDKSSEPVSVMGRWLHLKNLYEERLPVTGDRFFGREEALTRLARTCADGGHVGVFGMRRIGKTSVLRQLRSRLADAESSIPVDLDLQASSASGSAAHVAYGLGWRLGDVVGRDESIDLTKEVVRGDELALPGRWDAEDPRLLISNLCDGVTRLLEERLSDHRLVVILDEAEVLMPQGRWLSHALDLLRGLRAIAQRTDRLSLVIAGVNATPCEESVIDGEDNPLFGSVAPLYLGPLDTAAAADLIRTVGFRMGLSWPETCVEAIVRDVGAHPFFARLAAAEVAERHPDRPCGVQEAIVTDVLEGLPRARQAELSEVLDGLRRHYPSESDVLRLVLDGDAGGDEIETAYPREFLHLSAYGLVDARTGRIAVPLLKRWFERYGAP